MSHWNDNSLPDELQDVACRLREERPEVSALDLDRIKQRARARAFPSRTRGSTLKSRIVVALLTLGLMAGGTGGVIAAGGGNSGGNASNSQYKPGCGPKKTNGVNPSGTHTGQPGKDPNRGDCPQ